MQTTRLRQEISRWENLALYCVHAEGVGGWGDGGSGEKILAMIDKHQKRKEKGDAYMCKM